MSGRRDFTVVWRDGAALVHAPQCPLVEIARAQGRPILTMIECVKPPPADWARHDCLALEEPAA